MPELAEDYVRGVDEEHEIPFQALHIDDVAMLAKLEEGQLHLHCPRFRHPLIPSVEHLLVPFL